MLYAQTQSTHVYPPAHIGFQYVAWSPDSSRVAATADSSAMCVCVWDVHLRQQTHHLHVDRPLMGVVFAPWDASLLACAARREVVHVLQLLPEGRLHHQALSCGMVRRPTEEMHEHVQCLSRIITGMTIDAETRSLLIAQRVCVGNTKVCIRRWHTTHIP